MRFTASSSVSSSSTANSFRENFCTSKGSNFGCLSGFLSRILCSKTLPPHPSDPIETDNKKQGFLKIVDDGSATPNVVARLMGLDLASEFNSRNTQQGSDSIKQKELVNSGDLRQHTGEIHRRAKTCFSFKETPEFFELEDDDFLVPSRVEKTASKKKKTGLKFGNSEVGVKGHKQRGRRDNCGRKQSRNGDEQSKNRVFSIEDRLSLNISAQNSHKIDNNISARNQSYHLSPLKEESDGIKARKKKKKDSCLIDSSKEEGDSENLSPVSVLDHTEFISDQEAATSEDDAKLREGSHPRRRDLDLDLVGRDFACDQIPSNESSIWEERQRGGNKERAGTAGFNKREWRKHEILSRVHRLAEAEMTASPTNYSKWKYRGMLRTTELEDASTEFGQLIFDRLLVELVHQLLGLQCQDF